MTTIVTGTLAESGATCEHTDGTVYGVVVNASGDLCVYDDILGTPTLGDSDTPTTVHGAGVIGWICAVIDANDLIHIVSACTSSETRGIAYATYNTTTSTLSTWEGWVYAEGAPPDRIWCAIGVDGSQYPWIGYMDVFKYHGTNYNHMYHSERTSGSWSTPEKSDLEADATEFVGTAGPLGWGLGGNGTSGNYIYIYWRGTDTYADFRTRTSSWQAKTDNTSIAIAATGEHTAWPSIIVAPNAAVYRLIAPGAGGYIRNGNGFGTPPNPGSPYFTFSYHVTRDQPLRQSYLFVDGTDDDLHLNVSGHTFWVPSVDARGAQDTGTFLRVVGGYSYDNPPFCNNAMYSNGTTIYGIQVQCPGLYANAYVTHT